jgi:hypothetical protein
VTSTLYGSPSRRIILEIVLSFPEYSTFNLSIIINLKLFLLILINYYLILINYIKGARCSECLDRVEKLGRNTPTTLQQQQQQQQ